MDGWGVRGIWRVTVYELMDWRASSWCRAADCLCLADMESLDKLSAVTGLLISGVLSNHIVPNGSKHFPQILSNECQSRPFPLTPATQATQAERALALPEASNASRPHLTTPPCSLADGNVEWPRELSSRLKGSLAIPP